MSVSHRSPQCPQLSPGQVAVETRLFVGRSWNDPSPALPPNQEASGPFRVGVLSSPSHGRAEGHMQSDNPSSFLRQTLWSTVRPGQLCHHHTSFSSRNAVGFIISHPFLLFVLWPCTKRSRSSRKTMKRKQTQHQAEQLEPMKDFASFYLLMCEPRS